MWIERGGGGEEQRIKTHCVRLVAAHAHAVVEVSTEPRYAKREGIKEKEEEVTFFFPLPGDLHFFYLCTISLREGWYFRETFIDAAYYLALACIACLPLHLNASFRHQQRKTEDTPFYFTFFHRRTI